MQDMPRKLPRYVYKETDRHGKARTYFRRSKKHPRIALPPFGTDSFDDAYLAALSGQDAPKTEKRGVNSLSWLIHQYRLSSAYMGLSVATRRQRDNIFKHVEESAGSQPYKNITRKVIVAGRERRVSTPSQARNFLDAMRGLFRWALESDLIEVDPTQGVKNPPRPKGDGFKAWTQDDISAYEARWPEGTKERVWLHVLLYTGLRRGDAVLIGKQHVKDGVATLKTEKTGTEVNIPVLPQLAHTLSIGPTGDLSFICGENGRPLKKESFGNYFKAACKAAGIADKSAHGLRKIGATMAAEAGATVSELEALFGWTGGTMAMHYTKTASRKKLAMAASEKMRNTYSPNLSGNSPNLKNNDKKSKV